jgi:O-antigen ligase
VAVLFGIWAVALVVRSRATALTVLTIVLLGFPYALAIQPLLVLYRDSFGYMTGITLSSVLLLAAFVTTLSEKREGFAEPVRTEPVLWLLAAIAFFGVLTQSIHIGVIPAVGVVYIRVVQPMMFVWLIARTVRREGSLYPIVVAFIGAAAVGLFSRVLLAVAGAQGLVNFEGRISAIGSWTIYGTILAATVMLLIGLSLHSRSVAASGLWVLGIPVVLSELFATQTRGAILGLVSATAFVFARRRKVGPALAMAAVVALLLVTNAGLQLAEGRILTLDPTEMISQSSAVVRFARNAKAIDYIVGNPLTGLGLGRPTRSDESDISVWVDNPYLAWGVSFGLPALLAFLGAMVVTVRSAVRGIRRALGREQYLRLAVLAALGAWIVNQFTTGDSLTYLQSIDSVLFFYGIVGMVLGSEWLDRRAASPVQVESTPDPRIAGYQEDTVTGESVLSRRPHEVLREQPDDAQC